MENFFDAFISYGRADSKVFASKLYVQLKAQEFKIWFDQNNIYTAEDFQEKIDSGIKKSHNFLFVISPHSVNSEYCLKEINLAVKYNKRIIPLLHVEKITQEIWQQRNPDKTEEDWQDYQEKGLHLTYDNPNMHEIICKINSLYFGENEDDFDGALNSLLKTFDKHKKYVEQHTYYLTKGLEWLKNQKQSNYLLVGEEREKATDWLLKRFDDLPPCIPTDLHCEFISESLKNANNLMTHVFLAYSNKDKIINKKVRKSLMRESFTVWTNNTDIKTGITFEQAMNKGVEEADNFVYLMSQESLESKYCQQELAHAFTHNKRIIPLLIEDISLDSIPSQVRELNFIDFTGYEQENIYQENMAKLLKELKQESHYHEKHKILLVQALKWQRQNKNPSLLLRGYNLQHFEAWLKVAKTRNEHPSTSLQKEFINASLKQPERASLDVFIAYSRTDSDLARKLNDNLQELGKTTWFDQESIATGTDFQKAIYRGIASCDNFLFIISPKSINSRYCADEVEYAQKLNKRFVTILYRPLSAKDKQNLHPTLASVQWLDFNKHGGEFTANFNELIRTLDTDRDHVRSHTEWSQKALKWQQMKQDEALLLRGSELAIAKKWLKEAQKNKKQPFPTQLQEQFIGASWELSDRLKQEKEDRRKRDIRNSRLIAVGSTLAFAVSSILAVIAWNKTTEAQLHLADSSARHALSLFRERKGLKGTIEAIKAGKILQKHNATDPEVTRALQVNLNQQTESNELKGHDKSVDSVSISPDGKIMVSGSRDSTIKMWDLQTGRFIRTLFGHDESVHSISISGDSQTMVSGSGDDTIKIWDLRTGDEIRTLYGHKGRVNSVSISRDGKKIVSGSADNTIKIWNLESGQLIRTLYGHDKSVYSVAISPDNKTMVSGSADNTIKIWNLESGEEIDTLDGHNGVVNSVTISPDNKTMVSGSDDETIKIWDFESGEEIDTLFGHDHHVYSISIGPDGQTMVSGSADNTIKIWNLQSGKLIRSISGHNMSVYSVSISADGKTFVSGSRDTIIKVWNLEHLEAIRTLSGNHDLIDIVSISADDQLLIFRSWDNTIKVWDLRTGALTYTLSAHHDLVKGDAIRQYIVSRSRDNTIKVWSQTGKLIRTFSGHHQDITRINIRPYPKRIVSGSLDNNTIKLWNLHTERLIRTLSGHNNYVISVAMSQDGKTVVSGSRDKTIKVWNLQTEEKPRTFSGHDDGVISLSISADGKTVVSGSRDKTIRVWNLERGEEIYTLYGHNGSVHTVRISQDGKTVVSGSEDKTMKVWNLEQLTLENLMTRNCEQVRVYLANPSADISDEQRKLCDGIGED